MTTFENVGVLIQGKVWFELDLFPYKYSNICKPSHPSYLSAYEDGTDRLFRNVGIKFRRRGITQKKANIKFAHCNIHLPLALWRWMKLHNWELHNLLRMATKLRKAGNYLLAVSWQEDLNHGLLG